MRRRAVIWVDPARITHKIRNSNALFQKEVAGGDWDIDWRVPLSLNQKHRSIRQRYIEGARWEDTDIFRGQYAVRFAFGGTVRGAKSIEALAKQYYDKVDALYASLRDDGFLTRIKDKRVPLPVVLIGRSGEVFIGNQGNHRLAMATVLKLEKIPVEIGCHHADFRAGAVQDSPRRGNQ